MLNYIIFWKDMLKEAFTGSRLYMGTLIFLILFVLSALAVYSEQLIEGLIVTNMSNEVSWGIGIANFVYFVGVAAAAVILVFPSYVHHNKELKEVVIIGEILAFVAIMMCLLFIYTDIGRPDRFWHLIPGIGGKLNLPSSMLGWDVIVFNGYLLINLHVPGYLLWMMYQNKEPKKMFYLPFVLLSIVWAVSIHTVTAFLLSGLGVRYFWNTAVMAPRFLISAFASGPALLILIFSVIRAKTALKVSESVFETMRKVMTYTCLMNLFLFGCEIFKEFYTDTWHAASAQYLLFGVNGRGNLRPFIWTSLVIQIIGFVLLLIQNPQWRPKLVRIASVLLIIGIWIEKGMGLVLPGFIPSPLGNFREYAPSWHEVYICAGILALGTVIFMTAAKAAIAIQTGSLRIKPGSKQKP